MGGKAAIFPLSISLFFCALVVTGCGGSGSTPSVTPTISSVAVACSPASISTAQTSTCAATVTGTGSFSTSVTWSVSPTSAGSVSGSGVFTPTSAGTATITAASEQNSTISGSASVTVIFAAPSNLVYPQTTISATTGLAITPDTPTVTGTVSSYSVSPALPAGLTLNTSTGTISGTPTTAAPQTAYTVTATNSSGSTTSTLQITVTPAAPSSLIYPQTTISGSVGQTITPDIPTATSTVSSYSISPALPAGLSLDTSAGTISGTPSAASAQTVYTVIATNPGGSTTATVSITVIHAPSTLLELGHASPIQVLRFEGGNVLSKDQSGHWALWNYASDALLAGGDSNGGEPGGSQTAPVGPGSVDMVGQTIVIGVANGLEVHSQTNGQLLSVIVSPGLNTVNSPESNTSWWKLASDGSYICIGSQAGLFVYTPAGQIITSQPGDFSLAKVFAAPGQVLVALGPAGQSVIQSISIVDSTSTVSPAFSGQFNSWFVDGGSFLTNESTTVWVYSNAGVQQALVSLPTVVNLTGQGNWIWTFDDSGDDPNYPVDIYPIGSETPAFSYTGAADTIAVASGNTLGILPFGAGQVKVIDLSGATPIQTDYTAPIPYLRAYAASSSSQWIVGDLHGVLLDGASVSSTPRYFGQGMAFSIAGASDSAAVSTAIGNIYVFNPTQSSPEETIPFLSGKLALSSDGTVLGASAFAGDAQYEQDRTLNFYSLPSESVISTFPYQFPTLTDFTLAASGTTIGQVIGNVQQVTDISGGTVIWSDTGSDNPILLSPDGTLVAVYTGTVLTQFTTNIFKNGILVTSVPGIAVGWIDNDRLLVDQYNIQTHVGLEYSGAVVLSSAGALLSTLPLLPAMTSLQPVDSDSVYDPSSNAIYSLTTGQPIWTASFPGSGVGAVSGPYVVYESGHSVVVETP